MTAWKFTRKVVTNEKLGGSGSWLVFEDDFGPWRSMLNFEKFMDHEFPKIVGH
jgi:hypothetical protein